jgi:quercetin 2,3-dioxygenase
METLVERVGRVGPWQELGPGARNRFVVTPGDFAVQSPYVLLVEDQIEPGTDFHPHPHKGLETVTFVMSGTLQHGDNVGNRGLIGPGDIQWMTAGKGIVHGGQPIPGAPVHALQLWMALPAALRNAAPGTREQRLASSISAPSASTTARRYGVGTEAPDGEKWSQWPLALTDIQMEASSRRQASLRAGERSFFYIIDGTVSFDGSPHTAGSVIWAKVAETPGSIDLHATTPARIVQYSSPVINEPIVARGPFVMGSEAEIRLAFHEFHTVGFGGVTPV